MPTVTPANRRTARLIERDRSTLDAIGINKAALIGLKARQHAVAAYRIGMSPAAAIRDVIMGNRRLGLPGAVPLILDAMKAAHLKGHWRTMIQAAPQFRADGTYKLAGTAYDDALDFLRRRLELTPDVVSHLGETYGEAAKAATQAFSEELERKVQQAILESTLAGHGVNKGVQAIRGAFEDAGFTPGRSYAIEGIFRTQTQIAYSAGRWNGLQDDDVQEILWGYQYCTVGDDRVRPSHAEMDGVKAPKDDPLWQKWWAPAGYNCRCTNLEIFNDQSIAEPTIVPDVEPDKGWGFNVGEMYRDVIRRQAA